MYHLTETFCDSGGLQPHVSWQCGHPVFLPAPSLPRMCWNRSTRASTIHGQGCCKHICCTCFLFSIFGEMAFFKLQLRFELGDVGDLGLSKVHLGIFHLSYPYCRQAHVGTSREAGVRLPNHSPQGWIALGLKTA